MDGGILASTTPMTISLDSKDAKSTKGAVTLDQAITRAARHLVDNTPNMQTLVIGGLVFENSGAQPPFAIYVKDRLSASLQASASNALSGNKLRVIPWSNREPRGGQETYVLTGKYWDLSETIELRVSLENKANNSYRG